MTSLRRFALQIGLLAIFSSPGWAADSPGGEAPEPHRGPPPEALAACKTLASGAACGFTGPRGSVTGTCWAPEGRPLACRPNGAPPPGGGTAGGGQPPAH